MEPANSDLFDRLAPDGKQRRQCAAIAKTGSRCRAWAVTGLDQCSVHSGIVRLDPLSGSKASREAAERRRKDRMNVRDRLATELHENQDDVVAALKESVKNGKPTERSRAAIAWVQAVYGRQLQQPKDEDDKPIDAVSSEARAALLDELAAAHPSIAAELGIGRSENGRIPNTESA